MHRMIISAAVFTFAFATSAAFAQQAGEVTGECKDGTSTKAQSKEGACSSHGGVKSWQGPKTAAAAERPADATGKCKDGTFSTASSKSGACSGHKGVSDWYKANNEKSGAPAASDAQGGKTSPTHASAPERSDRAQGGGNGKVWVNTRSKVYHCGNDRWYGKTKSGEYMSEADAKAAGNHADHGKSCSA